MSSNTLSCSLSWTFSNWIYISRKFKARSNIKWKKKQIREATVIFSARQKGNQKVSYSEKLKTRNISWLSGYCKFRHRLRPYLDSRFRSIFRNFLVSEMPAVEMNEKNTWVLHSQRCLLLFVIDSFVTYCVHFQTIELNEILQSLTRICLAALWKIVSVQ